MSLFSRNKEPGIRKWTNTVEERTARRANDENVDDIAFLFAFSFLKGISSIFVTKGRSRKSAADANTQQVAKQFDNDWCLFETMCYVLFRLDLWVFANESAEFRDEIFYGKVIQQCLSAFQEILGTDDVFSTFNNRVGIFGKLTREHKGFETEMHYLTQFLYKTVQNKKPELYDIEKHYPLVIAGAFDTFALQTTIAAYLESMLPVHIDAIKYVKTEALRLGAVSE